MNIGARIRDLRAAKGLSQGDMEHRTGLLRCYFSRVENGHTNPGIDTLQKIAKALEVPLAELFCEAPPGMEQAGAGVALGEEDIRFLTQIQRYTADLDAGDRQILLALIRKFTGAPLHGADALRAAAARKEH
jgi:transcriptional regulator with XRE-family HTH domain